MIDLSIDHNEVSPNDTLRGGDDGENEYLESVESIRLDSGDNEGKKSQELKMSDRSPISKNAGTNNTQYIDSDDSIVKNYKLLFQ